MITVSIFNEYIYCPMKVYIRYMENSNIQTNTILTNEITHEAITGFEELIKRNIWNLNGEIRVKDILNSLYNNVPEFLNTIYKRYHDDMFDSDAEDVFNNLKEDLKFVALMIAIKTQKILRSGLTGAEAIDLLFPPSLTEFRIEDRELGLSGRLDKIEIIDGVYYPVEIKTSLPPLKGVWESDALKITAYSILMESEFNKTVNVGFINYVRVGTRKPVIINSILRNKFLDKFKELTSMLYNDLMPVFVQNAKKCDACEYSGICEYNIDK